MAHQDNTTGTAQPIFGWTGFHPASQTTGPSIPGQIITMPIGWPSLPDPRIEVLESRILGLERQLQTVNELAMTLYKRLDELTRKPTGEELRQRMIDRAKEHAEMIAHGQYSSAPKIAKPYAQGETFDTVKVTLDGAGTPDEAPTIRCPVCWETDAKAWRITTLKAELSCGCSISIRDYSKRLEDKKNAND